MTGLKHCPLEHGHQPFLSSPRDRPEGTSRKLLDVSRVEAMGWKARIGLREGVADTYAWYLENAATASRGQSSPR